jgi:uncharacterized protein (DUF2147 family)
MRAKLATAFAVLVALGAGGHAIAANRSPVGLWQAVDPDTKQPTGWFAVTQHDGKYDATLVKMFLRPGQDPNVVCDKCRDDRHDKRWLGLQIIRGMQRDGDKYDGGTILDPRDGNIYDAMMTVSPDGRTLIVRGFLGFAFLGRNEYWSRLPDSDYARLDPSVKSLIDSPRQAADPARR